MAKIKKIQENFKSYLVPQSCFDQKDIRGLVRQYQWPKFVGNRFLNFGLIFLKNGF
jgi:hypothetical protein